MITSLLSPESISSLASTTEFTLHAAKLFRSLEAVQRLFEPTQATLVRNFKRVRLGIRKRMVANLRTESVTSILTEADPFSKELWHQETRDSAVAQARQARVDGTLRATPITSRPRTSFKDPVGRTRPPRASPYPPLLGRALPSRSASTFAATPSAPHGPSRGSFRTSSRGHPPSHKGFYHPSAAQPRGSSYHFPSRGAPHAPRGVSSSRGSQVFRNSNVAPQRGTLF